MLFAWITDPNAWLALGTLTLLEIVLGIDNIIFPLWSWLSPLPPSAPMRAPDRFDGRDGHASGAAFGLNRLGRCLPTRSYRFRSGDLVSRSDLLLGGYSYLGKPVKRSMNLSKVKRRGWKTNVHPSSAPTCDHAAGYHLWSLDSVITAVGPVGSSVHHDGGSGDRGGGDDVRRATHRRFC